MLPTFPGERKTQPISAAVLAGGQSRRMGQDKALLSLRPGDPPLAKLVLDRVSRIADEVMIVASDRPAYEGFGVPVVPDLYPGKGVLGGIASALAATRHSHCFVIACDLPFLNEELLRWMAAQPRDYDVLVPRMPGVSRQGGGFIFETLHAIYSKRCQPVVVERLARDDLQVVGFFPMVEVRSFGPEVIDRLDPAGQAFFNANSPEAAAAAVRLLASKPVSPETMR